MVIGTMLPDLAGEMAETLTEVLMKRKVEDMTLEEISTSVQVCSFLRDLFAKAGGSIEDNLSHGVDAKTFVGQYENAIPGLESILRTVEQVVAKLRSGAPPADQLVSNYRALKDEIAGLREFLAAAVAKAKLPARPVDRKRAQESETAHAKGETKPFQRSAS